MPSAGSASTSSRLPRLDRVERARSRLRCTPRTAVTTPIRGRASRGQAARSRRPAYMPISRTAARARGRAAAASAAARSRCSGCPRCGASRSARPSTVGDRLLGRGLGDAARDSDDERVEPGPPAGRDRAERHEPVGHRRTVTSPSASSSVRRNGPRDHQRGGAGTAASARKRWPSVRSPGSATKSWPGPTRRRIDGRRRGSGARCAQQPAAGEADEVVGGEGGASLRCSWQPRVIRGVRSAGAGVRRRRALDGHGSKCGTGPASAPRAVTDRPAAPASPRAGGSGSRTRRRDARPWRRAGTAPSR